VNSELFPSPPHPFEQLLFTPAAGYRNWETGRLDLVGAHGNYWASSTFMPGSYYGTGIFLATLYCYPLDGTPRAFGFSVRCVQHLPRSCLFHKQLFFVPMFGLQVVLRYFRNKPEVVFSSRNRKSLSGL